MALNKIRKILANLLFKIAWKISHKDTKDIFQKEIDDLLATVNQNMKLMAESKWRGHENN